MTCWPKLGERSLPDSVVESEKRAKRKTTKMLFSCYVDHIFFAKISVLIFQLFKLCSYNLGSLKTQMQQEITLSLYDVIFTQCHTFEIGLVTTAQLNLTKQREKPQDLRPKFEYIHALDIRF